MASRGIAWVLVLQLGMPVAPLMAGESRQSGGAPYWIEATLVGVDMPQRSVSYRVATGDVRTTAVASDAALRTLGGLKGGQRVRLKCRQTDTSSIVVEEVKKIKQGHNWWKWGVLTFLTFGVILVVVGLSLPSNDALL